MPKKDAKAESEGVVDAPLPDEAKRATRAKATASPPTTASDVIAPSGAESEGADGPVSPKRSGLGLKARATVGGLKRPKVALIGGAIIVVGLNVWMALVVDGWKSQDADLRAENTALGQELAEAQATNTFQKDQLALFTAQDAAAEERASALDPVAAQHREVSDELKAAGFDLRTCVNERATLVALLWTSTASAQAGYEAQVNAQCDAAEAKFKAIPEDN